MKLIDNALKKKDELIEEGMRRGYYSLHQMLVFRYFIRLLLIIVIIIIPIVFFSRMCNDGSFGLCTDSTMGIALQAGFLAAVIWMIILIGKPLFRKKKQSVEK